MWRFLRVFKPAHSKVDDFRDGRTRLSDNDFLADFGLTPGTEAAEGALAVRRAVAGVGFSASGLADARRFPECCGPLPGGTMRRGAGQGRPDNFEVRRQGRMPAVAMTAQLHERLILDSCETSIAFCPTIPVGDDRIEEVDVSTTVLQKNERIIFSTACWRRYLGTWEIRDGQLFLNELKGRYRIRDGKPLQADWFTGVLRIPKGKLLHLVNMGFASVYERELHIKVENGRVVASREIDNTGTPFDLGKLAHANLPGGENRFPGDTDL